MGAVTGERLIETHRGLLAVSLLERGFSIRKAAGLANVSVPGCWALKQWAKLHRGKAEAIDSVFKTSAKLVAYESITAITPKKLKDASAVDNMKVAKEAGIIAGLVTPTPSLPTNHLNVLQQFFGAQAGMKSISAIDALPDQRKHEQDGAGEQAKSPDACVPVESNAEESNT